MRSWNPCTTAMCAFASFSVATRKTPHSGSNVLQTTEYSDYWYFSYKQAKSVLMENEPRKLDYTVSL